MLLAVQLMHGMLSAAHAQAQGTQLYRDLQQHTRQVLAAAGGGACKPGSTRSLRIRCQLQRWQILSCRTASAVEAASHQLQKCGCSTGAAKLATTANRPEQCAPGGHTAVAHAAEAAALPVPGRSASADRPPGYAWHPCHGEPANVPLQRLCQAVHSDRMGPAWQQVTPEGGLHKG